MLGTVLGGGRIREISKPALVGSAETGAAAPMQLHCSFSQVELQLRRNQFPLQQLVAPVLENKSNGPSAEDEMSA